MSLKKFSPWGGLSVQRLKRCYPLRLTLSAADLLVGTAHGVSVEMKDYFYNCMWVTAKYMVQELRDLLTGRKACCGSRRAVAPDRKGDAALALLTVCNENLMLKVDFNQAPHSQRTAACYRSMGGDCM